jgi:hypothetical protein
VSKTPITWLPHPDNPHWWVIGYSGEQLVAQIKVIDQSIWINYFFSPFTQDNTKFRFGTAENYRHVLPRLQAMVETLYGFETMDSAEPCAVIST